MGRLTAGVVEALRVTFARDTLPAPPPPRSPQAARGRGVYSLLFQPEPLPSDLPPVRARGGRWLAWLLSPEKLDPPRP